MSAKSTSSRSTRTTTGDALRPAGTYATLTPGQSVRIARELQELSQAELARASGVPQPAISAIEAGALALGVERAKKLARSLKVHPAVLLFPDWDVKRESA